MSTEYLFLLFLIYAFIGWVGEEIWTGIGQRKLTKRGMLFGPICPIYGFGALGILYLLQPWKDTWVRLFFASMIVTSVLEYITSWLLEKTLHAKWWDYSGRPFNLNGRCCLLNSAAFGAGGLALEHLIHPVVTKVLFSKLLEPYIRWITLGLAVVLGLDILFTLRRLVDLNATLAKFRTYSEQLKERFGGEEWFREQNLHTMIESVKEKAKADSSKFSRKFMESFESYTKRQKTFEFWLKKFPTMSTKEYHNAFDYLKHMTQSYWAEQKRLISETKQKKQKKQNKK